MEGFYTLLETNPIGMLFRFSFRDGRFVGSMMSPTYGDDDEYFEDVPIFELSFTEKAEMLPKLIGYPVRLGRVPDGTKRAAMISISRYPNMHPLTIEGRRIDIDLTDYSDEDKEEEKTSFVSSMLGTLYDSMRVLLNNDGDETFRSTPFRRLMWAWHPMNSDDEENRNFGGVSGKPLSMLKELMDVLRASKQPPRSLTFRYVNGPGLIDDVYRKGMPMIPAGLYHGCYNQMYGKFRREVILVYYKKYTWSSASERTQCLKRMKKEIFSNGVDQSDPENLFIQISSRFSADNDSAVWVLGRKVTGDYHVTCDRLTFCALVSHRRSETSEDKFRKITMVRDRGDDGHGKTYPVIRRFMGCGTLSFPGFHSPSWDEGRLVQIESDERSPSFAFVWGREQDFDSGTPAKGTVLRWVQDQDRFPFFSRNRTF